MMSLLYELRPFDSTSTGKFPMRILVIFLAVFGFSMAQAEKSKENNEPRLIYIALSHPFVANFGQSSSKMSYVKAEVSLRTMSNLEEAVKRHIPYLRNEIVLLLSKQDAETMTSNEGKERLRNEALVKVRAVMAREEGRPMIEDLLFTSFVVQR
jgi:flagellar protein FliL